MKHTKKLFALVLCIALALGLAVPALAAPVINKTTGVTGSASITVNLPAVAAGAIANNTYKIYKVFDATVSESGISYKLVSGKTEAPAGFKVDTAGNVMYTGSGTSVGLGNTQLTDTDITAIAEYVTALDPVATVTTTTEDKSFTVVGLPYGYYYITTTTGSVVTVNSTKPNATVNDKNTVPTVDKKITGASSYDTDGKKALAQVGTDVTFTATITVGKGAKGYVFHDTMSDGLTYKNDVAVSGADGKYTIKTTPDEGDTITITFVDGIAEGTVITITYSATINESALTNDPEKNTAYVSYGDENSHNRTPNTGTEVYNAKFTVTKEDGDKKPLAGAGFVIKNSENRYYKIDNNVVSWVDRIDDATEYTSDSTGAVTAFTGLANGTYTLIEKTVPAGYNKAADFTFTIAEHDYSTTNLEQTTTVINNAGSVLPETGGMGTTLFYIVGGVMVAAAVVLLITKKRMGSEA